MKKLVSKDSYLIILVFILFGISGCEKNEIQNQDNQILKFENFNLYNCKDLLIENKVINFQVNKLSRVVDFQSSKGNIINFDYSNLYIGSKTNDLGRIIMARQENYNENSPENYGIGFYENSNSDIVNGIIVKCTTINTHIKQRDYYDLDSRLIFSIELNSSSETSKILYSIPSDGKGCGEDVAHCMSDYYTECGWGSVALAVITYLIPEVSLLVIYDCIMQNCID